MLLKNEAVSIGPTQCTSEHEGISMGPIDSVHVTEKKSEPINSVAENDSEAVIDIHLRTVNAEDLNLPDQETVVNMMAMDEDLQISEQDEDDVGDAPSPTIPLVGDKDTQESIKTPSPSKLLNFRFI